eukprot:symbB.v1.2.034695.t1/scaffold4526.1/size39880/1
MDPGRDLATEGQNRSQSSWQAYDSALDLAIKSTIERENSWRGGWPGQLHFVGRCTEEANVRLFRDLLERELEVIHRKITSRLEKRKQKDGQNGANGQEHLVQGAWSPPAQPPSLWGNPPPNGYDGYQVSMGMERAVRGVTTAVHTDTQILHSAAVVDFIGWVRTLVENGHLEDAAELWDSVAEVVHMPVPESPLREFASLPPMRRIPCCVEDCTRCRDQRGRFRFPWLGVWSRGSLVVQPGMSPSDAWMALGERQELMDIMLVEVYASGFYLRDLMPVAWDGMVSRAVEAPGCARVSTVFRMFRHWQLGHELWRDPAVSMATRAESRGAGSKGYGGVVAVRCGLPGFAHSSFVCPMWIPHPPSMRGVLGFFLPYVHVGPRRPPLLTGPLGPIGSWGGGAILASQHASVWRLRMARAGIGRPVKQSTLVEAGRVAAWRDENGLQDDGDFAFRFSSWEQAVSGLGALRPGGELTPSLRADWEASCRRLAQAMVTASEPVTISNALMTVSELEMWMQTRQRSLVPGLIDLDNFVHQGTPAPTRSLNALRWLSKLWWWAHLCWATWRNRLKAFSKPVIRPGPRCWALAGRGGSLALQAYQQVSLSTFHAHCPRGKQRRLRGGFDFCIPATFTSGWNWTGPWLELWKELPVEKKGRCGLCFDSHGVAWDLTEVHQQARLCFRNQVETPELMTSYSWRRLMPTVGHLLQFQPASLAALGDWQEKKDEEPSTKMALRYSSARYQESTRVKHLTLSALSQLQGFEAWEMICPENVEEAKHHAERAVNQALHRDGHLVWSTPITASEVAVRCPASSEEECGAMHRCGVLLRTGRVCGGRHPGLRCYDKRAILVENGSAALSIQPIRKRPAEPKEEPPPKAKAKPKKKARPALPTPEVGRPPSAAARSSSSPAAPLPVVQAPVVDERQGMAVWFAYGGQQGPLPSRSFADLLLCRRGESILIHCVAGRHRAAAVGTLARALLAQETIAESDTWIRARRSSRKSSTRTTLASRYVEPAWAKPWQLKPPGFMLKLPLDLTRGGVGRPSDGRQCPECRTVKQSFWRRYKLRFPAEVHPADATVSRVSREMGKRMLCVYNVWKVKSLQFQLHTTQRKRKLADGLYMDDQEEDESTGQDADSYLDRLRTLMLAYALAGSQPLAGAPTTVEDLGADSTSYVAAPLDIMLAYYLRAKRTTMQVALGRRLQWLQARDAEERAEWVTRYRESTLPLGQIVKEVFAARDAHWLPMASPTSAAATGGRRRPAPQPLRSESFPDGLPNLSARDQLRVEKDNAASSFILHEIDRLERSGGAAVRENPYHSLHWHVQQEVDMWATGRWKDKQYASCVFAGARCKQQRLRHNLDEIDSWPIPACHHTHAANEWEAWMRNGVRVYPSAEEAEYTAPLSFAIAVAASARFMWVGGTTPIGQDLACDCVWQDLCEADMLAGSRLRGSLRQYRQKAVGMLSELASRWRGVTTHLRDIQPPSVAAVTASRDVGLVALLMVVLQWPDVTYPHGLILGLPAVGFAPCYGIFPELEVPRTTFEEVLGNWEFDNAVILQNLRAGKDDEFLLQQSLDDAQQGFCTEPMNRAQLLWGHLIGSSPAVLSLSLPASSASLTMLPRGGRALMHYLSSAELLQCWEGDSLESGGEDWPNAYRHSPMGVRESHGCVVTFWHHGWGQPAFQIYAGLLFGLPLAVTSFNRYSKFVEACGRRLGSVLVSMYFDDATITDWASSKGSGQFTFGRINQLLGTPFADEKRQAMQAMQASSWGWSMTFPLACLQVSRFALGSQDVFFLFLIYRIQRFCVASDAALEQPRQGTGGFLIVWFNEGKEMREAFVSLIPQELYDIWSPGDRKIAQLELVQVLYALVSRPSFFRGRRGIWMLDNTAAVMSLIRGRSDSSDLELLSHMIHTALFALRVWIYWEWVPSK